MIFKRNFKQLFKVLFSLFLLFKCLQSTFFLTGNFISHVSQLQLKLFSFSTAFKYKISNKLTLLEKDLFPFLENINRTLVESFQSHSQSDVPRGISRGGMSQHRTTSKTELLFNAIVPNSAAIVISIADAFVNQSIASIKMIRVLLRSNLDIVLVHNGLELSIENRRLLIESTSLDQIENVKIVDLATILGQRISSKIRGFNMKPFAILAALNYDNVILMDADVFFFQKPDLLFKNALFLETGALFFRDRPIKDPLTSTKYMNQVVQAASLFVFDQNRKENQDDGLENKDRLYEELPEFFKNHETIHVMESGVVVINKRENFLELLTVLLLTDTKWLQKYLSKYFYGDKELFWVGFEMAHYRVTPNYKFTPAGWTGAIGIANRNLETTSTKTESLCSSQILHALDDGRSLATTGSATTIAPFWMNGGFLKNKYDIHSKPELKTRFDFVDWMVPALDINAKNSALASKHYHWYFEQNFLACLECDLTIVSGVNKDTDLPISCIRPLPDSMLFLLEQGIDL